MGRSSGLRSPRSGELEPQVCIGWWEEQCLSLHGLSGLQDAPELMAQFGGRWGQATVGIGIAGGRWGGCERSTLAFHELDCLLIHGSTISYADELTPETPAIELCDRLIRADANTLFCGRSGQTFECWVTPSKTAIDRYDPRRHTGATGYGEKNPVAWWGVGSVGRTPGQATYTLYNPGSDSSPLLKRFPTAKSKIVKTGGYSRLE